MIRFVLSPEMEVVPDLKRKLPGRGVWVTARAHYVAEAVRKGAFGRGFKAKVSAPPDLADRIDALLMRDALQFLALANKAGVVIAGSAKVEAAIARGGVAVLLHAADAGADGVRKLGQALTRNHGQGAAEVPRVRLFDGAQMDLALGRSNVIHAALKASAATDAFLERCRRVELYRSSAPTETGPRIERDDVATHEDV
jgi:predicted RNA-binding protein YlxR (DUF448 family)